MNILIVEDEAIIARMLELTLQRMGHRVVEIVDCCCETLMTLRKEKVDLIFMDIRIKGRNDGIQVAEFVNEMFGTPVVFLTGHSDIETLERVRRVRHSGYIPKPAHEIHLRNAIQDVIVQNSSSPPVENVLQ